MSLHVFDAALQLQPQGDGVYLGATSPAWANMVDHRLPIERKAEA